MQTSVYKYDCTSGVLKEKGQENNTASGAIARECDAIKTMLLDKNRKYGNSALEPLRLFSTADAIEQINVRIDDKLSRLQSGQIDETEDVELDLIGYLILKRIARKAVPQANGADRDSVRPFCTNALQMGKTRMIKTP